MMSFGPYTPVRHAGNLLFVSGQIGIDPTTKHTYDDVAKQTAQALKNMENALHAERAGLQDVIKTTVFLVDMSDFSEMNRVYEQMFVVPRPARSTVAVHELPRVAGDTPIRVEIEAVAQVQTS